MNAGMFRSELGEISSAAQSIVFVFASDHAVHGDHSLPFSMLQAASAWFSSSQISQNYAISSQQSNGFGSSSASTSTNAIPPVKPFTIGPWKVQEAHHKLTQKKASVWSCDKKSTEMERLGPAGKDMVLDVLKTEVSTVPAARTIRSCCTGVCSG